MAPAVTSSSIVSMRLMVSGPVSYFSIARRFDDAALRISLELRFIRVVRVLRFLFGVEVIEIPRNSSKPWLRREHRVQVA